MIKLKIKQKFVYGIVTLVIGALLTFAGYLVKRHYSVIDSKNDVEVALANDEDSASKILKLRNYQCIRKDYTEVQKLHVAAIELQSKLMNDINQYIILFKKSAQKNIIDGSSRTVQFIEKNEKYFDSCSAESAKKLSEINYSETIRFPSKKYIMLESGNL